MITRRSLILSAAATPLFARAALAAKPQIFAKGGVAINGYDPVAYFTQKTHVKGNSAHKISHMGAEWHFASAENLAKFSASPEAYAPQYGGYCAFAVAHGSTAKTDPDAWSIHDGKLYLNFNTDVRARWRADIPGFVARADANWPKVLEA